MKTSRYTDQLSPLWHKLSPALRGSRYTRSLTLNFLLSPLVHNNILIFIMINVNIVFLITVIILASRNLFKISIEGRSIIAVNAASLQDTMHKKRQEFFLNDVQIYRVDLELAAACNQYVPADHGLQLTTFAGVVEECTTTIIQQVAGLKPLVSAFSRFSIYPGNIPYHTLCTGSSMKYSLFTVEP
jgi:hypothetical protein